MSKISTLEVFGVSNEYIRTYVERPEVDDLFVRGLTRNKHIVIYGASKQGKTSLTNKHLSAGSFIRINCSYNSEPIDLYKSLIRQLGIEFTESKENTSGAQTSSSLGMKAEVKIPFVVSGEMTVDTSGSTQSERKETFKTVEYNLGLAQDVVEILTSFNFNNRRVVLENFHYLSEETQKQLAIDLRVFEDSNILFIILGIWREKNRLPQYNGDLVDRLIEIPVEPWSKKDLSRIVEIGESLLNISFEKIKERLIDACFDSVGVFQELCKESCLVAGINEVSDIKFEVLPEHLDMAIGKKLLDYSSRHIRSIESFVQQEAKSSDAIPLYMRYYFVRVVFSAPFNMVTDGLRRKYLQDEIQKIHHRADDVRASDMGYLLQTLVSKQIENGVKPPIFDYDQSTKTVKVIDSTFYFFLRNSDREELIAEIPVPVGLNK
jgi:hypothetical protein